MSDTGLRWDCTERWAKAALVQRVRVYPALRTTEEQQIFLARSRQIDLQLRQAGNGAWAGTSRACANIGKATTCATSAGPPPRGAAA